MKITPTIAADVMGCSPQFVRIGLQTRQLNIGDAVRFPSGKWVYCINPVKLAERQGMTVEELNKIIGG